MTGLDRSLRFPGQPAGIDPARATMTTRGITMPVARDMLRSTPSQIGFDRDDLAACIEACFDAA